MELLERLPQLRKGAPGSRVCVPGLTSRAKPFQIRSSRPPVFIPDGRTAVVPRTEAERPEVSTNFRAEPSTHTFPAPIVRRLGMPRNPPAISPCIYLMQGLNQSNAWQRSTGYP